MQELQCGGLEKEPHAGGHRHRKVGASPSHNYLENPVKYLATAPFCVCCLYEKFFYFSSYFSHPIIINVIRFATILSWFWEALSHMSTEDMARFLQFCTGTWIQTRATPLLPFRNEAWWKYQKDVDCGALADFILYQRSIGTCLSLLSVLRILLSFCGSGSRQKSQCGSGSMNLVNNDKQNTSIADLSDIYS